MNLIFWVAVSVSALAAGAAFLAHHYEKAPVAREDDTGFHIEG